jgi:antitoxin (DNA-binding transcriptional repressor) of toxin-antitoxin stability system
MNSATIRDLRNEFPRPARWIEEGECVEITRSGKPFAHLTPIPPPAAGHAKMPDFLARIREHFPNETPGKGIACSWMTSRTGFSSSCPFSHPPIIRKPPNWWIATVSVSAPAVST